MHILKTRNEAAEYFLNDPNIPTINEEVEQELTIISNGNQRTNKRQSAQHGWVSCGILQIFLE